MDVHAAIDAWVDSHFDEEVRFLQALVRVPTDSPPGDTAPHAELTATLLGELGLPAERHPVPEHEVRARGLRSITNLIVRHRFGEGPTIALAAHGDVVPPGEGWTHDPYGAEIVDGVMYGRAAAVSKSDFATYTFALRALQSTRAATRGTVELHFTYDEESGGELGPAWLLARGLTRPDYLIAAGFGYHVLTAHDGCLQLEVTVHGQSAHAAIPRTGADALRAAHAILSALYEHGGQLASIRSSVPGIDHPTLNVGTIQGGTSANVVPGTVTMRLDRRLVPEEASAAVEQALCSLIETAAAPFPGIRVQIRRLLLADAWRPDPRSGPLVQALQRHGEAVFGEPIPALGTPLYTDVRLYAAHGVAAAIYGAGPRTVLESNAKRADERLVLEDLRRATKVVARAIADLLG